MNYQLTDVGVRRIDDGADIPNDGGNTDWQLFQLWLNQGNTPQAQAPDQWQSNALADLTTRTDRMQVVVTVMETDYLAAADTVNAAACVTLKTQLDALASDATLLATTSRQAFNTAARTKLRAIVQSAPAAVRIRLARDPSL